MRKIIFANLLLVSVLLGESQLMENDEEIFFKSLEENNLPNSINTVIEACENKNMASACSELGKFYSKGNLDLNITSDFKKAREYIAKRDKINLKKCDDGFIKSCINTGGIERAESLAKLKCNDTSTESCKDVVWLAEYSNDFDEQYKSIYTKKSADLYSYTCMYGDKESCSNVNSAGVQFSKESNTTENIKKALGYYLTACDSKNGEAGDDYACRNAAISYDKLKNYSDGHLYFVKSCKKKNVNSCYDVGVNFYFGYGVGYKSIDTAYDYFKEPCKFKIGKSCEYMAEIEKTKAEIEKQRKLAEETKKQEELKIKQFRQKKFEEGDQTNCGPVIEAKTKMLKIYFPVQGYGNEHWIMKDTILPAGYGCRFYNGRYVGN